VVRGDPATQPHAWFLADQRSVPKLPGDLPSPTPSPLASASAFAPVRRVSPSVCRELALEVVADEHLAAGRR